MKLDLNAAEIKIAENEAALAVLRASHDVQVQTIKELTSRVEASRPSSDANDTSSTDDKHAELIAMVEDKDKQIAAALARSEVAEKKSLDAEREVASDLSRKLSAMALKFCWKTLSEPPSRRTPS